MDWQLINVPSEWLKIHACVLMIEEEEGLRKRSERQSNRQGKP